LLLAGYSARSVFIYFYLFFSIIENGRAVRLFLLIASAFALIRFDSLARIANGKLDISRMQSDNYRS